MAVQTPVIGTGGGGLQKGDANGFVIINLAAVAVRITAGEIEANGKVFTATVFTNHVVTGFTGGFTRHYIYIDDSASTAPTAVFIDSTTEPIFDFVKDGYYNGNDRCIGIFYEESAGNAVGYFDTVSMSGRYIRNITNRTDTPKLATNQQPGGGGTLVAPNTNSSSGLLHVNAVELYIGMSVTDAAGQNVTVAAASSEWFIEDSLVVNAPFKSSGVQSIFDSAWITLDASRDIVIGAESDDDPASLNAEVGGEGYRR